MQSPMKCGHVFPIVIQYLRITPWGLDDLRWRRRRVEIVSCLFIGDQQIFIELQHFPVHGLTCQRGITYFGGATESNWIENTATLAHEPWQWIATFSFYVSLAVSPTINEWNCDIGNGRNKLKHIGFCDTLRKIGNNNSNVLLLPHMQLLQRIVFYSNRETEAAIYMHMELPAQARQWNNNSRRGKQNGISLLFNSSLSRWRGEDKNSFIGKVGLLL